MGHSWCVWKIKILFRKFEIRTQFGHYHSSIVVNFLLPTMQLEDLASRLAAGRKPTEILGLKMPLPPPQG